jgi:hypothetical protein
VAIRPTDIQSSIWQASQTAPLTQRAEEGPRAAQQAAQASFAAQVQQREERVGATGEAEGNKIDANAERRHGGDGYEPQERQPRGAFEAAVDDAARLDEPHLIDFTA